MIRDFDDVTKQLTKLASVINSFKSEAVQLRIVELMFGDGGLQFEEEPEKEGGGVSTKKRAVKKKTRKVKKAATKVARAAREGGPPRGSSDRPGPGQLLDGLISQGFFKERRSSKNITDHCAQNMAMTYKTSDLSKALTRAIRDDKLKREKSKDGPYEYFQP